MRISRYISVAANGMISFYLRDGSIGTIFSSLQLERSQLGLRTPTIIFSIGMILRAVINVHELNCEAKERSLWCLKKENNPCLCSKKEQKSGIMILIRSVLSVYVASWTLILQLVLSVFYSLEMPLGSWSLLSRYPISTTLMSLPTTSASCST